MRKMERIDPDALRDNPRATFAAWKRYESIVLLAYRRFPQPYLISPPRMSPATVASRLRDAIRGAIAFNYCTEVPAIDLARWYEKVVIKHTTSHVFIGPPPDKEAPPIVAPEVTRDSTLTFDSLPFEEVTAFALLLSRNRLQGPIIIQNPPDLSQLPDFPNLQRLDKNGALVLI